MGGITKRQSTAFIPFNGGVDEYHDSTKIGDNRFKSAVDIHIDGGQLTYRPGRRLWGPVFADTFDGVIDYVGPDGTARLLVASGGVVYEVDSTTKTARDSGLTQETLHFTVHRGRAWYNGANTQRKISTTTAARVGIVAPTAAPTITHSGAALADGSYGWVYTFVIEESGVKIWESNPSPVLSHTLSSEGAVIKCDASADTRVNARYIYRTTASGAIYQYSGRIGDNTAATGYQDTVTGANLGAVVETNRGVPTAGTISEGCNERMFRIAGDKLIFSEQAHTEAYQEYQAQLEYFHVLPGGGLGTGLKRLYNVNTGREDLIVFQKDSLNILPGGDPNIPLVSVIKHVGCIQHDTIVEYRGAIVFLSNKDTVESYSGGRSVNISSRNIPVSLKNALAKGDCRASLIFDHYYALSTRDDAGKLYKNSTWVCDLRTVREVEAGMADACWYKWSFNAEYVMQRADGTVLAFDNNVKRIYSLSLENKDDETTAAVYSAITPEWETKDFNFGLFVRFRPHNVNLKGEQASNLNIQANYSSQFRSSSKTTAVGAVFSVPFVMGKSLMGTPMTAISNVMSVPVPVQVCGLWVSFKFSKVDKDLFFSLSGMEFSYSAFKRV